VTRLLSSNLLKFNRVIVHGDEKRVIDSNEQMEIKINHLREIMRNEIKDAEGENAFLEGLDAQVVEALLEDTDNPEQGTEVSHHGVAKAEPVYKGPSPEELAEQARIQADSMLAEASREAETIRKTAYNEGYLKGIEAGNAEAEKKQRAEILKLSEQKKQLEEEYQNKMEELEPMFIDTLTEIYEHVFHADLSRFRGVIMYSLQDIISGGESNKDFIIHAASDDYMYLLERKATISEMVSENATVEIIMDITLMQGQCMIETGGGVFDCGIDTQLEGLARQLKMLSFEKKK